MSLHIYRITEDGVKRWMCAAIYSRVLLGWFPGHPPPVETSGYNEPNLLKQVEGVLRRGKGMIWLPGYFQKGTCLMVRNPQHVLRGEGNLCRHGDGCTTHFSDNPNPLLTVIKAMIT
jgi:hypothetical protein